jgi:hypothetical protein
MMTGAESRRGNNALPVLRIIVSKCDTVGTRSYPDRGHWNLPWPVFVCEFDSLDPQMVTLAMSLCTKTMLRRQVDEDIPDCHVRLGP